MMTDWIQKWRNVTGSVTIGNVTSSNDSVLKQTVHNIHGPDIPQIEPIIKIKLFHFCLYLDKCLIFLTSFPLRKKMHCREQFLRTASEYSAIVL